MTLTVTGNNFVSGSVVRWNGNPRTTTFGGATQLTAAIAAADIASAGSVSVTVANPALPFTITAATTGSLHHLEQHCDAGDRVGGRCPGRRARREVHERQGPVASPSPRITPPPGYYSVTWPYFSARVDSPPLHVLSSAEAGGNGVYTYRAGGFPTATYWVDVVFSDASAATAAPTMVTLMRSPDQ